MNDSVFKGAVLPLKSNLSRKQRHIHTFNSKSSQSLLLNQRAMVDLKQPKLNLINGLICSLGWRLHNIHMFQYHIRQLNIISTLSIFIPQKGGISSYSLAAGMISKRRDRQITYSGSLTQFGVWSGEGAPPWRSSRAGTLASTGSSAIGEPNQGSPHQQEVYHPKGKCFLHT